VLPFGVFYGGLILGERLPPSAFAAMVLILLSLLALRWRSSTRHRRA
jgi:drug/metabolite transporter (DMT)-like permease